MILYIPTTAVVMESRKWDLFLRCSIDTQLQVQLVLIALTWFLLFIALRLQPRTCIA